MTSFRFAIVQRNGLDLCLWLHNRNTPVMSEWDLAIQQIEVLKARGPKWEESVRALVITDGGGPNATQRSKLYRDLCGGKPLKTSGFCIEFDSPIIRGLGTVITWLNPGLAIFRPNDVFGGMKHVDLPDQWSTVWPELEKLQQSFEPVKTLELMRRATQAQSESPR